MSHQLSECPNCGRTFIGDKRRLGAAPGRCRVCGTQLTSTGAEREAEVRDRLYGPHASLSTVTRVSALDRTPGETR